MEYRYNENVIPQILSPYEEIQLLLQELERSIATFNISSDIQNQVRFEMIIYKFNSLLMKCKSYKDIIIDDEEKFKELWQGKQLQSGSWSIIPATMIEIFLKKNINIMITTQDGKKFILNNSLLMMYIIKILSQISEHCSMISHEIELPEKAEEVEVG